MLHSVFRGRLSKPQMIHIHSTSPLSNRLFRKRKLRSLPSRGTRKVPSSRTLYLRNRHDMQHKKRRAEMTITKITTKYSLLQVFLSSPSAQSRESGWHSSSDPHQTQPLLGENVVPTQSSQLPLSKQVELLSVPRWSKDAEE
jgi:hypothetical protein